MELKRFWTAAAIAGVINYCPVIESAQSAPVIWNGPNISFTRPSGANWMLPQNQDRITDGVWITRGPTNGLFNASSETGFSFGVSPADTEWAWEFDNPGQTIAASNYQNLVFDQWYFAHNANPPSTVNRPGVLHLISDDIYIDIMFTSWGQGTSGGGAFSYVRSTPPVTPICPADLDDSGAVDVFDLFVLLGGWGTSGTGADLASPTDVIDVFDLFELLSTWGPCPL